MVGHIALSQCTALLLTGLACPQIWRILVLWAPNVCCSFVGLHAAFAHGLPLQDLPKVEVERVVLLIHLAIEYVLVHRVQPLREPLFLLELSPQVFQEVYI